MELAKLLEVPLGITAVIGSGGKTSLLRRLGEELADSGRRVLLCTTTKIFPFPSMPCATGAQELETLAGQFSLLCAGTPGPEGKLTAPSTPMEELAHRFDYVLVEADGAAGRPLKAHAPHEPVIPPESRQVIAVVGASGFFTPIAQAAHRPERYARLAEVDIETLADGQTQAAVMAAERLYQKIYVNQVENEQQLGQARRLALLLGCPVVAGSLRKEAYTLCWC